MNYSTEGLLKEARKHSDVLINIIYKNKFQKIAEIGVYEGKTTKRILNNLEVNKIITEYWDIDPWSVVPVEYGSWSEWPQETWDAKYLKSCKLMKYFPALKLVKMPSLKAVHIFEDGYFNFIYIDGNHLYDAVVQDLTAWLPKVRSGGILAGHDYINRDGKGRRSKCEVKRAVDDTFGRNNIQLEADSVWVYQT